MYNIGIWNERSFQPRSSFQEIYLTCENVVTTGVLVF